jgi:hypothetical protein
MVRDSNAAQEVSIMSNISPHLRTGLVKALSLFLAFVWVASDAALAGQSRAGSTRSGSSASSGSSSGSSGSVSKGSSRSGSSSAGASRRSAVPRSGASARGSAGAARTRPYSGRSYNRGHGSSHHGSSYYGHFGYYGYPRYWNPFWGFWSFGYGYGPGYGYGYGPGYGYYPPVVYSNHRGYRMGALDLNVRPKNTEVYVDGQYVGLAKQYDGFPGHLWLEKGVYEVAFYRPGFETQTRTVKILTDLILDLEIEMFEGQAVQPEMRLEPSIGDEGVDEYVRRAPPVRDRAPTVKQSRMHVNVEPGNATVYLDGNLLGTGDELAGLRAGLILSAGSHTLEVSGEGFETIERRILVEPGEEVDLAFELKPLARAGV